MEVINGVVIPSALSLLLSLLLCPVTARISGTIDAIDRPDGIRKINTVPIPRLGGLGFFTAFFISVIPLLPSGERAIYALLAGGAVIVAAGVADDTYSISPFAKLLMQIAAAAVGVSILGIPEEYSFLGIFSISPPAAVSFIIATVRIVFSINAVNFCDGLDGLATGLSAVALLAVSAFALSCGKAEISAVSVILVFSLLGFFPYNRHPAKIYMGDSGSQFLGFAIAMLAIGAGILPLKRFSFSVFQLSTPGFRL